MLYPLSYEGLRPICYLPGHTQGCPGVPGTPSGGPRAESALVEHIPTTRIPAVGRASACLRRSLFPVASASTAASVPGVTHAPQSVTGVARVGARIDTPAVPEGVMDDELLIGPGWGRIDKSVHDLGVPNTTANVMLERPAPTGRNQGPAADADGPRL